MSQGLWVDYMVKEMRASGVGERPQLPEPPMECVGCHAVIGERDLFFRVSSHRRPDSVYCAKCSDPVTSRQP